MATSNNNVIVSRIQNRRGLKQDLPNPLRPGELGLATDSKQLYIGADTEIQAGAYNKILSLENTTGAQDAIKSIANNQIITFTVPHIRYPVGSFSGTEKTLSYTPSTTKVYTLPNSGSDSRKTFRSTVTDGNLINLETNLAFTAETITIVKNGEVLSGLDKKIDEPDEDATIVDLVSKDYIFSSNTALANTHTATFRNLLTSTDEVAVTYYGNSAVIQALDGFSSSNTQITYYSEALNFYDQYSIPDYRKIDEKFIRVSPTTGVGHIGLEYKHISIVADSSADVTVSGLGNLRTSNASDIENSITFTPSGASNVVVTVDNSGTLYNASSYYNHIYVENLTNSWVNNKAVPLTASNTTSVSFTLPSGNTWQTARTCTAAASVGTSTTITGNVDGLSVNDTVRFIGSGASQFNDLNKKYVVQSLTSSSFTVTEDNVSSDVANNLDYINYGSDASGANVQIFSANHGVPVGGQFKLAGSSATGQVANGNATLIGTATDNTFFMAAAGAGSSNVTGTASVVFGSDTSGSITRVRSTDLSSATTLNEVTAIVNNLSDADAWESLQLVPDNTNRIYFSSKASKSSTPFNFRLHNDSADTLSKLQLLDSDYINGSKLYDRDTTVKAKLEKWLDGTLKSTEINLFESVATNQIYASNTFLNPHDIESFPIDIDNEFSEMSFASNEEAENFAYIINNMYFAKTGFDVKGLLTTKLNIEILTSIGSSSGLKTTTFDVTNTATISDSNVIASSELPISTATYDTHVLEYSVKYNGTSDGNYRRTGTIYLNAFENSVTGNSDVIIQDIASDVSDTLSGNVSFGATYNSVTNLITLTAQNTTNKNLTMNWIQRRWSS